jgi:serine/threonine protein kinase
MADNIKSIGRFSIIRLLGKGAQSAVYLAFDPSLQREVAIKTLHFSDAADRKDQVRALIQEAQIVSQLRHPNIVPIFEIGEEDGDPYLVFEYVEGQNLAEFLREKKSLPIQEAVEIMISVLEAIIHAHKHGIIHRDLKPSNILINLEHITRVMDFGIATRISDNPLENFGLSGTPSYMAPEYIQSQTISAQNDIFAAGLILCEMLTGHKVVPGRNPDEIMNYIITETITLPAGSESVIDEKLGDIILKALARDPQSRYSSALIMRDALRAYLANEELKEAPPAEGTAQSTLEFLLRRMRHKSDFPALSESISAINRISPERDSIAALSNQILKDFALTSKILKIVNTVLYRPYGGGSISTVSRAVSVMGFDAVRNIAIALILFEHLQNKAHAAQLKEEFLRTLFSAILARTIAHRRDKRESEEIFICTLFHNLGRLLSLFYFSEEAAAIAKIVTQKGLSEEAASAQVLGISYEEMGIGITRIWGFPEQISGSMRRLPQDTVRAPRTHIDELRITAGFATDLCMQIAATPIDDKARIIRKFTDRFGEYLPAEMESLPEQLRHALEEISQYASSIQASFLQSQFGKKVILWLAPEAEKPAEELSPLEDTATHNLLEPTLDLAGKISKVSEAQSILAAGIQDVSNSLIEDRSLNDILRMILEIMYRSMKFEHVLLCVRDTRQDAMQGRFGFGENIDQFAAAFRFLLDDEEDNVFLAAVFNDADILISNIEDPKVKPHIPAWFKKAGQAQTFMLFPIGIKRTPMALIYADKKQAGDIVVAENELNLLRTLRNQAILAFRQA